MDFGLRFVIASRCTCTLAAKQSQNNRRLPRAKNALAMTYSRATKVDEDEGSPFQNGVNDTSPCPLLKKERVRDCLISQKITTDEHR